MDMRQENTLKGLASLIRLNIRDQKMYPLKHSYCYKDKIIARANRPKYFKERNTVKSDNIDNSNTSCKQEYGTHFNAAKRIKTSNKCSSKQGHHKRTFRCGQCPYITDRKNNLKRHITTMHESCLKVLECCHIVFANKAALREHVGQHHRNGYLCEECGRNFCRKALLKRHVTVHSGQKDHVCDVCGYATSHKSNLDRHTRRHRTKSVDAVPHNGTDDDTNWQKYIVRLNHRERCNKTVWNIKETTKFFLPQDCRHNTDALALGLQDKYSKYLDGRLNKTTNSFASSRILSSCHDQLLCSPLAVLYDSQGRDPVHDCHIPSSHGRTDTKTSHVIVKACDTGIQPEDSHETLYQSERYESSDNLLHGTKNGYTRFSNGYFLENNNEPILKEDNKSTEVSPITGQISDKWEVSSQSSNIDNRYNLQEDINLCSEMTDHTENLKQEKREAWDNTENQSKSSLYQRYSNCWERKRLYPYMYRCDHGECCKSFANQWDWYLHSNGLDEVHVQRQWPTPQRPLSLQIRAFISLNNYRKAIAAYI